MRDLHVTPDPFPHLVVDGFWDSLLLLDVLNEFPAPEAPGWRRYDSGTERKAEGGPMMWGPATGQLFNHFRSLGPKLAEVFDLPELHMETVGGGYHLIEPGGYLQMHADFNRSPNTRRYRRLNLLVYLNAEWDDPGGHLELWDADGPVRDVAPEFNRMVVFQTSSTSWHGHPVPASRARRSVAAYFYTDEAPPDYTEEHSTVWHAHA